MRKETWTTKIWKTNEMQPKKNLLEVITTLAAMLNRAMTLVLNETWTSLDNVLAIAAIIVVLPSAAAASYRAVKAILGK